MFGMCFSLSEWIDCKKGLRPEKSDAWCFTDYYYWGWWNTEAVRNSVFLCDLMARLPDCEIIMRFECDIQDDRMIRDNKCEGGKALHLTRQTVALASRSIFPCDLMARMPGCKTKALAVTSRYIFLCDLRARICKVSPIWMWNTEVKVSVLDLEGLKSTLKILVSLDFSPL